MTNLSAANKHEGAQGVPGANHKKIKRSAKAQWQSNLDEGKGSISTQSGILEAAGYNMNTPFNAKVKETNPEELFAAAFAGCFAKSVAAILAESGLIKSKIDAKAVVTLSGSEIITVHVTITGRVDGISASDFFAVTKAAEKSCMISKILKIPVTYQPYFRV